MNFRIIVILILMHFVQPEILYAHPGGNMVVCEKYVLWSYVYPFDDVQHHASVMIWDKKTSVEVLFSSRYSGSNFFLYARNDSIYYLELRHLSSGDKGLFRILKGRIGEKPDEIWPWTENENILSSNGFYMISDETIVFCRYPGIFVLNKGDRDRTFMEFDGAINRMRKLNDGSMLLLSDKKCWLLNQDLQTTRVWNNFIDKTMENIPMGINKVFDIDYKDGRLILAYWGGRSFLSVNENGEILELLKLEPPFTAHWVGIYEDEIYLFSSRINPPELITPELFRVKKGDVDKIW